MIVEETISSQPQPGDPQHDPNGPQIQTHGLESGELLITFSPEWADQMDWRVGDTLVWTINEEVGGMTLTCPEAEERKAQQSEADMRRQDIEDHARMTDEGAPG